MVWISWAARRALITWLAVGDHPSSLSWLMSGCVKTYCTNEIICAYRYSYIYIYIIWCIYIHCKHSIHIHICVYMRYTHDCYPVMAGIPRSSIWPRSRLAAKHPLGRKASRQELSWSDTCPNINTRWQDHNDYNPYGSTVVTTQKYLKHFLRRYLDPGEILGCLSSKQVAAGDRASSKVKQCQCE